MTIIDTSRYQGNIAASTFAGLRSSIGVTRSIHKAGGSNTGYQYVDSRYVANANAARAGGVALGHYWFNGKGDPATDARYFVSHLTAYKPGDWLIIDVESEGSMPHWSPLQVLVFARTVFELTNVKPVVYMSASVTKEAGWGAVRDYGCPLWVAQYGGSAPAVYTWHTYAAWQYTSSGAAPGIPGVVDLSHEGPGYAAATTGYQQVAVVTQIIEGKTDMAVHQLLHEVTIVPKGQTPQQAYLAVMDNCVVAINGAYLAALQKITGLKPVTVNQYDLAALNAVFAEQNRVTTSLTHA